MDFTPCFEYVREILKRLPKDPLNPFRDRFEHTQRVFRWASQLLDSQPDIKRDPVLLAAVFHDCGAPFGEEDHAEKSAAIFADYARKAGLNEKLTKRAFYLISNHSKKELLLRPSTPTDLVILMEADALDETGALAIMWDCMAAGSRGLGGYREALEQIEKYTVPLMNVNTMATPAARKIWEEKRQLMLSFLRHLKKDLEV